MKSIILSFCFFAITIFVKGQINTIPNAVKQYADATGQKLMNCCSSASSRNFSIDIKNWEIKKLTARAKIIITATWNGLLSGNQYWIKEKLICNVDGCNPKWEKLDDSKGFLAGCGTNCIKNCLE